MSLNPLKSKCRNFWHWHVIFRCSRKGKGENLIFILISCMWMLPNDVFVFVFEFLRLWLWRLLRKSLEWARWKTKIDFRSNTICNWHKENEQFLIWILNSEYVYIKCEQIKYDGPNKLHIHARSSLHSTHKLRQFNRQ